MGLPVALPPQSSPAQRGEVQLLSSEGALGFETAYPFKNFLRPK